MARTGYFAVNSAKFSGIFNLLRGCGKLIGASLSIATDQIFKSTHYVEQKPSLLHFEIKKEYVEQMLSEQGKYSGDITVVWDSDV